MRRPLTSAEDVMEAKRKFGAKRPQTRKEEIEAIKRRKSEINHAELPAGNPADIQHLTQQLTNGQPESAVIDDLMDKTILARFTFISENTLDRVLEAYSALRDPIQMFKEFKRRTKRDSEDKLQRFFTDARMDKVINMGEKSKQMKNLQASFGSGFTGDHKEQQMCRALLSLPCLLREKVESLVYINKDVLTLHPCVHAVVEEDGHIFNAQSCSYAVFVDRQKVVTALHLSQALLLAFCSYFVFDIQFPSYMRKTLIFLSAYVFGLSEKQDKSVQALANKVI